MWTKKSFGGDKRSLAASFQASFKEDFKLAKTKGNKQKTFSTEGSNTGLQSKSGKSNEVERLAQDAGGKYLALLVVSVVFRSYFLQICSSFDFWSPEYYGCKN